MKILRTLIRALAFTFVAYQIYFEAGLWTTIFSVYVYINLEFQSFLTAFQLHHLSEFMGDVIKKFETYERIFKVKSQEEMVEEEIKRRANQN